MYRNKELLHYQYFAKTDWTGGYYATATSCGKLTLNACALFLPTLPNSMTTGARGGLNSAMAWATMLYYGDSGYEQVFRKVRQTTIYVRDQLGQLCEIL